MIGIIGWGGYVPRYRLTGEIFKAAWGAGGKGERSVASYDEDAVTLGAEAALEAISGHDPLEVDRLYFASVSAPYLQHQNAAIVAAVADLRQDIFAADFGGSVRSSTAALRAGFDAIKADNASRVMVVAADLRQALPGDPLERELGDGAAALLLGQEDPLAVFKGFYSTSKIFLDYWRREGDPFIQSGDAKFIHDEGISRHLPEALEDLLEALDLARGDIQMVVFSSPNLGLRRALEKALGFQPQQYLADTLQARIGDTGSASPFLDLGTALAKAKPGDKILLLHHGSGADAILLEATPQITRFQCSLEGQLQKARPISSYEKYLSFRKVLPQEPLHVWSALPVLWREEKPNIRLLAKRCVKCGAVQYPPRQICWQCSGMEMKTQKLQRRGKVFTFTRDYLPPNPDPPTNMVSVDLEGGGRFYGQLTDLGSNPVEIGMEVELTFRRLHEGGGYNNYFWKLRPV